MHSWGYCKNNGPHKWVELAPAARGLHQSPVNIDTTKIDKFHFRPLKFQYVPKNSKTILNNGHTVQVALDGSDSLLEGGPFPHRYRAAQFHFHWGMNNNMGSEHMVDGRYFAAELHIVHWNCELYSSIEEAVKSANGLAVLGAFIKPGKHHHEMEKLTSMLPKILYSGESAELKDGFDPASLLPKHTDYWTYSGSLTTPPCYESARFVIFKEPIQISEDQLNSFRQLRSHARDTSAPRDDEFGGKILQNYRPPNPLNDRKIVSSC
ncbi:hypothetical protein HELRODRAFT_185695 [Helobdella robusta]|uniref:Carbonic anhydrase n=1 Tax=Helobdella robusta TaxID=6412 RepID=T1FN58_HELRO|nr:hypothetical protein HELRODRAFT_185695 [Helobdella robusta]ESO01624.1 hypothetical protein HELRODRAFT_185695 [Helobdella robusta]